jgi:hypothetical protein
MFFLSLDDHERITAIKEMLDYLLPRPKPEAPRSTPPLQRHEVNQGDSKTPK